MGVSPPVRQQTQDRTHSRQELGVLDLDSSPSSSVALVQHLTSTSLSPTWKWELQEPVSETHRTKGAKIWELQNHHSSPFPP